MKRNLKLLGVLMCVSACLSIITVGLFDLVNTMQRDMFEVMIGLSIVYSAIGIICCADMFDLGEERRTYDNR